MSAPMGDDVVRLLSRLGISDHRYQELGRARRSVAAAAAWSVLASTDRHIAARRAAADVATAPVAATTPAPAPAPRPAPTTVPANGGYALLAGPTRLSFQRR